MDRWVLPWDFWSVPFVPGGMPGFWPNFMATMVIATLVGAALAPRLGLSNRALGAVWLFCLLAPLAYTLTSAHVTASGCDIGLLPWESRSALFAGETRANILLTVPAGAAALLFPSGHRRLAALGAALSLPIAIELTQLLVGSLGRACQVSDIVNNTIGVLLGFWLAAGVWTLWVGLRGSGPPGDGGAAQASGSTEATTPRPASTSTAATPQASGSTAATTPRSASTPTAAAPPQAVTTDEPSGFRG